jgi:Undecaprenyl-phosphate glucose phosphotransferase
LQVCLFAADILAVALAGIASYVIWNRSLTLQPQYWGHILVGCVIFLLVMQLAGMYRFAALRRRQEHLVHLTGLWAVVILILIAIIFISHRADEYSRAWMALWAVGGWNALTGTRFFAWLAIRRLRGQFVTRVAICGKPAAVQRWARRLTDEGGGDIEVVGVFEPGDLRGTRASHDIDVPERLGAVDTRIDEIVLTVPCSAVPDLDAALDALGPRPVDIKVALDFATSRAARRLVLVPVWRAPLAGLPTVVKRAIDVCVGAVLLILVLPLMGVIAALIKLDSAGPALFTQQRFGFSKQPFTVYKFRSMQWEAGVDPSVPQAQRRDPRVTRVGRLLRGTSLDELPQLLNVLKGDMSLVGPRPHPTPLDDKYQALIEGYVARHHVKPGITGWAQVNGWRGETDTPEKMQRRVEHDIYYINHWSLMLDLRILLRTPAVVLRQRNAY